jgi:hypothetical protein
LSLIRISRPISLDGNDILTVKAGVDYHKTRTQLKRECSLWRLHFLAPLPKSHNRLQNHSGAVQGITYPTTVEDDPISGMKHTIYSLRHTPISMRIILSEGQVNVFNLAKNAGTSVDQIER